MLQITPKAFALALVLLASIPIAGPAAKAQAGDPTRSQPPVQPPVFPKLTHADLQVALDRSAFSPGQIDGHVGANTRKALSAFQKAQSLPVTGNLNAQTWKSLSTVSAGPTWAEYTITPEDAAGPYLPRIPEDMDEKAKLERLGYTSILEMLGERFHAAPDLLRHLNPRARFVASDKIKVPNTRLEAATVEAGDVRVEVSREAGTLTVDRDGEVVFFAPVTSGSEHDPLPIGDWKVKGVAHDPPFRYSPNLFWDSEASDSKTVIPSGPNNPVGVVRRMSRLRMRPESHLVDRIGWLRAAVLGANDGIVSTAGVHVAECLPGEVEGARLAEHVVGEDVDAPPADRRSATEQVEGRLVGQLPDPDPGELRSDPSDPLHNRGIHIGEVLAQRLLKHLRPEGKRGENQRCEDHRAHLDPCRDS
jgi:lipoprotein-anchoring transpeptidase ErfK/SrfK